MEICSGGIVGMGEEDDDVVDLAMELAALEAEAVPINFFQPIPGTPLAGATAGLSSSDSALLGKPAVAPIAGTNGEFGTLPSSPSPPGTDRRLVAPGGRGGPGLDARRCLKVLAMFRLAIPRCELRIAAGREMHLGTLQPLGLYAANSIFVG